MKRFVSAICLIGVTLQAAYAQTERPVFDSNNTLIMPTWMDKILSNSDGVNYKETVEKYNTYIQQLPNGGKKTPYNKTVINAFKWWMRTYQPFVDEKGIIRFPSNSAMTEMIERVNKKVAPKRTRHAFGEKQTWEVVSPFVTYDADTKKPTLWQSNVSRIDASNSNPNIVYIGTDTGMMFKTTDKGKNWTACDPLMFFGGEITSVEVSNSNPDKVVIGTVMNGLFLTEDGGDSWRSITPLKTEKKFLYRIRDAVFDPLDDNHIIVGTDEGVWDSRNNGQSWRRKLSGMCFDIKYQLTKNGTPKIFLLKDNNVSNGGNVYLYTSINNGVNYYKENLPIGNIASGRIGVSYADPNYVYILACQNTYPDQFFFRGTPYILKSTDAGKSFVSYSVHNQVDNMDKGGGQGYYDMVLDVSPNNAEHILFGLLFLYSSKDGGQTLDLYPQHYPSDTGVMKSTIGGYYGTYDLHTDMQDLDVAPDGTTWLTTDGGVVYSDDFMSSEPEIRHNGVYASELWGFDQGWNQDIIVGGRNHNGDMCQDLDNYEGKTISLKGSENATGYIFLSNERKIAFQDNRKKIIMPDKWDGEYKNFDPMSQFNVWPYESSMFGNTLEYNPMYAKSFLMVSDIGFNSGADHIKQKNQLWVTYDDGLSYELIKEFPKAISSYAISRSNPKKIVVATVGQLWYTTDGGTNWATYELPSQLKEIPVFRVGIHPTDENEIWLNTYDNNDGILYTKDNGENWIQANEGLMDMPKHDGISDRFFITHFFLTGNEKDAIYAIAVNKYKYDSYYHRFENRVVYRDKDLNKWVDISQGLRAGARINRLKPFYRDAKVRIATDNGVWQRTLVDDSFKPIAQPIILNMGRAEQKPTDNIIHLDSYSIAKGGEHTKWHWEIHPQPLSIDSYDIRNPKIKIDPDQSYNISLTVTSIVNGEEVSDTKEIKSLIKGTKPVPENDPIIVGIQKSENTKIKAELFPTLIEGNRPLCLHANNFGGTITLHLYDTQGRLSKILTVKDGDTIPTHDLQKGIHIYRLSAKGFEKVGRILIQ